MNLMSCLHSEIMHGERYHAFTKYWSHKNILIFHYQKYEHLFAIYCMSRLVAINTRKTKQAYSYRARLYVFEVGTLLLENLHLSLLRND